MTIEQAKCKEDCPDMGEEDGKPVCNKYNMWLNKSRPSGLYIMKCGECVDESSREQPSS